MGRLLLRLISWLPAAALVFGVAAVVYLHVRYTPRCTILTDELLHVSDDGRWLLTCSINGGTTEPVTVWDANSGQMTAKYFDMEHHCFIAPHRELLVGAGLDETMRFVDWRTGETKSVAIDGAIRNVVFVGRWCLVKPSAVAWMVIDLDGGRVVGRLSARGVVGYPRDARWVHVRNPDNIERWDLAEMRLNIEIPASCDELQLSRCGRWLGAWKQDAAHVGSWTIWDMNTGRQTCHVANLSFLTFSLDGSRIGLVRMNHDKEIGELQVVDTATGQVLLKQVVPYAWQCSGFSTDNVQACLTGPPEFPGTTMIEVATGKTVWEDSYNGWFYPDKNVVLPGLSSGAIREASTGNALFRGESVRCSPDCRFIFTLNDAAPKDSLGRWLARLMPTVFFGDGKLLQVVDADSMREVYRLRQPTATREPDCTVSADGSVLVTRRFIDSGATAYRLDVWNMNPWRARIAAGIASLATLLVILAFHRWRRRRARLNSGLAS